jgi:hypothetical protein
MQAAPPEPHSAVVVPAKQLPLLVHPAQELEHWPFTHIWLPVHTWQAEPRVPQAPSVSAVVKQ